ncbi:hypothetical protein CONPUDRAFT_147802 [Coniophora puteana RWD-64-598 SS2]|uniref:Uncharacterized protein n=1 Tax=Coniophora puteana (strain RWD-64-598) TaxID=741705 RepID=R7SDC4_CONPW|nr:uncharacterized protein CONPUDRAFT_147802 [Coniophora puteana RWD-64-598 SS2]EIW74163.1 hypothetical protein CONPUDRAFT_147802 [Coniophora puteana RWD-64-598 SS2]
MATPGDPALLRSLSQVQAVSALILVENSEPMVSLWPELQNDYLPSMLAAIRVAHPITPIRVMMLHSGLVTDHSTTSPTSHINFNEVPNITFNLDPSNRITPQSVRRAIELLSTPAQHSQTSRHLIIAAASNPSNGPPGRAGASEWQLLGQRLAEHGIQCHVISNMVPCSIGFSQLFFMNLRLQNHQKVEPWFHVDHTRYTFLLSSSNFGQHSAMPISLTSQGLGNAPSSARSGAHPLQIQSTLPSASRSPSPPYEEPIPSLVKELQKVHGISKKKVHRSSSKSKAASTSRGARERYRSDVPSLTVPSSVPSASSAPPPETDRSNRSLADRRKRSRHDNHAASDQPTRAVTMPQGQGAERVHQSPGTESSPSCSSATLSPGSSGSRTTSSPAVPIQLDSTYYVAAPHLTSQATTTSIDNRAYAQQPPVAPSLASSSLASALGPLPAVLSPTATVPVTSAGTDTTTPAGSYAQWDSSVPFEPSAPSSSMGAMSGKYRLDSMVAPSHSTASRAADSGDVPFLLSPEYEAETAAKLQAALASSHPPPIGTGSNDVTLTTSTATTSVTREYTTTTPAPGFVEAQSGAYAHVPPHTQGRGYPPLEFEDMPVIPAYTYIQPTPIDLPGSYGPYGTHSGEGLAGDDFADSEQYCDNVDAAYPVAPRSMTAFGPTSSSLHGWAG